VRAQGGATFNPTTGHEFKLTVALTLAKELPKCRARGFVREPDNMVAVESVRNVFIRELVEELRRFEQLYDRTQRHSEKPSAAAAFFVETYIDRLVRHKVSLFFESGSTMAFVARKMAQHLKGNVDSNLKGSPSIKISTNDLISFLHLWLRARIPCTVFPWSTPAEPRFGAAYGGLEKIAELPPNYRQPPLDGIARAEIRRLHEMDHSLTTMTSVGGERRAALLLGTTSGLQIGRHHNLMFAQDGPNYGGAPLTTQQRELISAEVSRCFGPHVGSYHAKVFKRYMYDTKLPIMVFLNSDKIDCAIQVGVTHFILDKELTWEDFYTKHPLAFVVGCDTLERQKFIDMFRALDFEIVEEDCFNPVSSFIARNKAFDEAFESLIPGDGWA
jgi:hypothetical protein